MLNIDTRLLEILDGNEIAILLHISKRISKEKESFPSIELLKKRVLMNRMASCKAMKQWGFFVCGIYTAEVCLQSLGNEFIVGLPQGLCALTRSITQGN